MKCISLFAYTIMSATNHINVWYVRSALTEYEFSEAFPPNKLLMVYSTKILAKPSASASNVFQWPCREGLIKVKSSSLWLECSKVLSLNKA